MVERSEELRLFDLHAVEELLPRTVGHHGHARLRKAIALYQPSSFTRSQLEKRFLELCIAAGLPRPHMNYVEAVIARVARLLSARGLYRAASTPSGV